MNRITSLVLCLSLTGCAGSPAPRAELQTLPELEKYASRVFISSGYASGVKMWSDMYVGPVFIDGRQVGSTAKDEHFVVDLQPGTHEAKCQPHKPDKNFARAVTVRLEPGETKYLQCNMHTKGAGVYFGLIGAAVSEYLSETVLEEAPLDKNSRLVGYTNLN